MKYFFSVVISKIIEVSDFKRTKEDSNLDHCSLSTECDAKDRDGSKSDSQPEPPKFSAFNTTEVGTDKDESGSEEQEDDSQISKSLTTNTLSLPSPGDTVTTTSDEETGTTQLRIVPNECSICLNFIRVGDQVSWSSEQCVHAFHQECIVEWLETMGRHFDRRRRHRSLQFNFNMLCPVCRQDFLPSSD